MQDEVDPRLMQRARKARTQYGDLYWVRLPLARPLGEDTDVGTDVIRIDHDEYDFLFRPLTREEYDQFTQDASISDVTDAVIETALLWPEGEWEKNPIQQVMPGIFEGVRDMIVDVSGFGDRRALYAGLNLGRAEENNIYGVIASFICKAFPKFSPDEVRRMTWLQQARLVAYAEMLLQTEFPLDDLLKDPKKERSNIPTDFSQLPKLTPEQIEGMRNNDPRYQAISQILQAKHDAQQAGEDFDRAAAARAQHMDRVAQQRLEEGAGRMGSF